MRTAFEGLRRIPFVGRKTSPPDGNRNPSSGMMRYLFRMRRRPGIVWLNSIPWCDLGLRLLRTSSSKLNEPAIIWRYKMNSVETSTVSAISCSELNCSVVQCVSQPIEASRECPDELEV